MSSTTQDLPIEQWDEQALILKVSEEKRILYCLFLAVFQAPPTGRQRKIGFQGVVKETLQEVVIQGKTKATEAQRCAFARLTEKGFYNEPSEIQQALQDFRLQTQFPAEFKRFVRFLADNTYARCLFVRTGSVGRYRNIGDGRVYSLDRGAFEHTDLDEFWRQNLFIFGRPYSFTLKNSTRKLRLVQFPIAIGSINDLEQFWGMTNYMLSELVYSPEREAVCHRFVFSKSVGARRMLHVCRHMEPPKVDSYLARAMAEVRVEASGENVPQGLVELWGAELARVLAQNAVHTLRLREMNLRSMPWDETLLEKHYQEKCKGLSSHRELNPSDLVLPEVPVGVLLAELDSPRMLLTSSRWRGLRFDSTDLERAIEELEAEKQRLADERAMLSRINGGQAKVFESEAEAQRFVAALNAKLQTLELDARGVVVKLPEVEVVQSGSLVNGLHIWQGDQGDVSYHASGANRQKTTALAMALAGGPPRQWSSDSRSAYGSVVAHCVCSIAVEGKNCELLVYQDGGSLNLVLCIC